MQACALHILLLADVAYGAVLSEKCDHGDETSLLQVKQSLSKRQQTPMEGAPPFPPTMPMTQPGTAELLMQASPQMQQMMQMQDMLMGLNKIMAALPKSREEEAHLLSHHPGDIDLGLMDPASTNYAAMGMMAAVLLAIGGGIYFSESGTPFPAWMVATLVICYLMWGIGIFVTNSSMLMLWQTITGDHIITTKNMQADPPTPGIMRESPSEMVRIMVQSDLTKVKSCGILCCVLAFAGPLVRLGCLLAGEYWRNRENSVLYSRICLMVVQRGSKWASPVFLLMIVMHCQFVAMDNGTDVTTKSTLEIGWMGYFLFCMTNLVLALSIKLPELPVEKADDRRDQSEDSRVSRQTVAYAVALAGCCYFCLLGVSMFKGTFSYDLPLPDSVWAGVPPTVHASVSLTRTSVWHCITILISRAYYSLQLMPLLAAITLLVFLVVLPVVDMCALVLVCCYATEKDFQLEKAQKALAISNKVRYALLSDVFVFAFYLMSISGMFALHEPVLALLLAELIRYVVTFAVVEGGVGIADHIHKAQKKYDACRSAKSTPWVEWEGGRWKVDRR
jgi:hypothetical protein